MQRLNPLKACSVVEEKWIKSLASKKLNKKKYNPFDPHILQLFVYSTLSLSPKFNWSSTYVQNGLRIYLP
jgi:hypothetical protein